MTQATIWFSGDGYLPKKGNINGRRMAGSSFLNGYMHHASTERFRAMAYSRKALQGFQYLVDEAKVSKPCDLFLAYDNKKLKETEVLYYSAPSLGEEAWRRYNVGQKQYAICGITHTTATSAVMEQIFEYFSSPVEAWDALICTSRTVKQSIEYQLDQTFEFYERRMGIRQRPALPMMPIIPIGVNCTDFQPSDQLRHEFRNKYKIDDDTIVIGLIARLSPFDKFDPIPYFLAVRGAQKLTKKRIVLVLCGEHPNKETEAMFQNAAHQIIPQNLILLLSGDRHDNRLRTLSASDIYAFPIDNIQETFGLSPIEGMAAGLPIITTDWNGIKDTVTPEVGFRVSTRMAEQSFSKEDAIRYRTNIDEYPQYLALQGAETEFDIGEMSRKIALLCDDRELRLEMGAAGRKRAFEHYDWRVVIPQMEALWEEQMAILKASGSNKAELYEGIEMPIAPPYAKLFSSYPTRQGIDADECFERSAEASAEAVERLFDLRNYKLLKRSPMHLDKILNVFEALETPANMAEVTERSFLGSMMVEKALIWLLKYGQIKKIEENS